MKYFASKQKQEYKTGKSLLHSQDIHNNPVDSFKTVF